ncbi:MAG: hypothetical protein AAF433_14840 [Bacteroidota bacterium]
MKFFYLLPLLLFALSANGQSNSSLSLQIQGGLNLQTQEHSQSGYSFSLGAAYELGKTDQIVSLYLGAGWQYDQFHRAVERSLLSVPPFRRYYWYYLELQQIYLRTGVNLQLNEKIQLRGYLGQGLLINGKYQRLEQFAVNDIDLDEASVVAAGQINRTEQLGNKYQRLDSRGIEFHLGIDLLYRLSPQLQASMGFSTTLIPINFQHLDADCFNEDCELLTPLATGEFTAAQNRLQLGLLYQF